MVAFDPPAEEGKGIEDMSDEQTWEVVVPALFAGLALAGLLADGDSATSEMTIDSAWKSGDMMGAEFMRRVKEKVNGRK